MSHQFLTGEDVRADIVGANGDVAYHIRKFDIELLRPGLDVSNSEGLPGKTNGAAAPGKQARKRGLKGVKLTIEEATFDFDLNVFDAPVAIQDNDYLRIKIYPFGREVTTEYHDITIQVQNVKHSGEVGQLQPVSFDGESDGDFSLYGDDK